MERKLNEQWVEEIDGKKHMYKALPCKDGKPCHGCDFGYFDMDVEHVRIHICSCKIHCDDNGKYIIKDLGILNEDGCLPAPWDSAKYPKITVLIGNVYNIEVMEGFWFMQVRGDTLEKAVE
ncbi:MAG: hypothetical protein EOM32_15115, partial [Spirochaetia bacterium]|nr:hypothetical protein [Spirochaetia bacterium]